MNPVPAMDRATIRIGNPDKRGRVVVTIRFGKERMSVRLSASEAVSKGMNLRNMGDLGLADMYASNRAENERLAKKESR